VTKYHRLLATLLLMPIVVATASGCAGRLSPAEPVPPAQSVTPTVETPALVNPESALQPQLFDGDCDRVLDPVTARTIFGADAVPAPALSSNSTPRLLGEIRCSWGSPSESAEPSGTAVAIIDTGAVAPRPEVECFYGPCWVSFSVSGMLFQISASMGDIHEESFDYDSALVVVTGELVAMQRAIEASVQTVESPRWQGVPDGSWSSSTVDCDALEAAADLDALIGVDVHGEKTVSGPNMSGEPMDITDEAAYIEVGNIHCFWEGATGKGGSLNLDLLRGQSFAVAEGARSPTATLVDIDGSELAYLGSSPDGYSVLDVQSGVNRMTIPYPERFDQRELVSALEKMLVVLNEEN